MNQRLALLSAILANPDDDLPRLVFADWLEENGTTDADAARVEFIRLGCKSRVKSKISTAETKWLDANWPRLLGATLAERPEAIEVPTLIRAGRFVRLVFRWQEKGRPRVTDVVFEYVRGFARRVEYTQGHGYQRFWRAAATDEPLAYHRPEHRPDARYDSRFRTPYSHLRQTWGDEVLARAIGFDEINSAGFKVYHRGAHDSTLAARLHPLALADEHGIAAPQHRVRAAVATAMTAIAREFVGLTWPSPAE
jgi:uncharacterized protein (TIGR02996 family)